MSLFSRLLYRGGACSASNAEKRDARWTRSEATQGCNCGLIKPERKMPTARKEEEKERTTPPEEE